MGNKDPDKFGQVVEDEDVAGEGEGDKKVSFKKDEEEKKAPEEPKEEITPANLLKKLDEILEERGKKVKKFVRFGVLGINKG